jgi:preprotein translocase subunit SecB
MWRASRAPREATASRWSKIAGFVFFTGVPRMADTAPNADTQPAPAAGGGMTAQLSIEKIYVKDLSLENPGAPQSFQLTDAPQIEIGLRTRAEQVAPDVYECVLTLTVTARSADKTVFLVEASQAGVFTIRGVPPQQMQGVLGVHCPTVLFPYARETVADATMRAGFPPVQLAPINFEALYQQQLAQASSEAPAVTN